MAILAEGWDSESAGQLSFPKHYGETSIFAHARRIGEQLPSSSRFALLQGTPDELSISKSPNSFSHLRGYHGAATEGWSERRSRAGTRKDKFASLTNLRVFLRVLHVMPKHRLSKAEQARGLRKALRSWRTPPWLKPSIRRYLKKMEKELRQEGRLK
jgi:hypothetical protein